MAAVDYDAIVIGAGFGGLRMLYELRKMGLKARVFESGTGIGGTWYWNRYPGARTDSESWVYILTFMERIGMQWTWKERFPQQPEVEEYLNHVADYLDLRKDIQLRSKISSAHRDDVRNVWTVTTEQGQVQTCRYLITAVGPLAAPLDPPYEGLSDFQGEWYRTATWPKHDVDFSGKRVAVVGTGATAVQVIPIIAHAAKQLTVFQRTPNFVIPSRNHPLGAEQSAEINRDYDDILARARGQNWGFDMVDSPLMYDSVKDSPDKVRRVLEKGWEKGGFRFLFETFGDILVNPDGNEAASEFVRDKIRTIVNDEKTAEILSPYYPIGSKRPPCGHHYFEAFNRPNVELVSIKDDPIQRLTPSGLKTGSREFDFDIIVFAIGFDAITGGLSRINIRGSEDQNIGEVLAKDLSTNMGITLHGFPNFFMIFGPQSPFANGPMIIDVTADWIGRTLERMRADGQDRCESTVEGCTKWSEHLNFVFESTAISRSSGDVGSWLVGANVKGKKKAPLMYFGGVPAYTAAVQKEISDHYPGHMFTQAAATTEVA